MTSRPWIKGPAWDIAFIALPWLPLAVLLLALLPDSHTRPRPTEGALALLFLALGALDVGHRLYTFPVAYADRSVFARHRRGLLIAPLVAAAILIPIRALEVSELLARALVTLLVLWNIWHVFMQRIGFLRIYAGKLGGSLREPRAARLDRGAVWALLAFTIVVGLATLGDAALSTGDGRQLSALLGPAVARAGTPLVALVGVAAVWTSARWVARERALEASWTERAPRLVFAASTAGLVLLPLWSPLVGVLCLKFSHAVEYIAFVHVYEGEKFRRSADAGWFGALMRRPWLAVPLCFALFCVLFQLANVPAYLAMFVAPLHFLYDGWIWKVRAPEVREPLLAPGA